MNFSLSHAGKVMKFALAANAEAALPANTNVFTYKLLWSDKEQVYVIAQFAGEQLVGYGEA